jgi:hypothetical protein
MYTLTLSSDEYAAVDEIYGPPQDVHYMIMCASFTKDFKQWALEGDFETFDELWGVIEERVMERVMERLCKRKHEAPLIEVMTKIEKEVWAKEGLGPFKDPDSRNVPQ